jgi:O-antigen/teichoic acid export membrane protein
MSTSEKIRFGIKWVGASSAVSQGVRFLTTALLARLLAPEMFGLVAIAGVTIGILAIVREAGISSAFIQREDADATEMRVAANTAFFIVFGLNSALFVVAWALAPRLAGFFESTPPEQLIPVLRAMSLVFLIDGVMTTPNMLLQKNLEFGKHALGAIAASLVNALVATSLALAGKGVWSLVIGQLSSLSVWAVLAMFLSGWRPRLEFSSTIARELFNYGKYLWAFGALSAVGDSLDRLLIGRWLGPASVGVYGLALSLSNLPATEVSRIIGRITLPWFSRIRSDPDGLRSAYLRTLSHVSMLSVPLAFGMLAVSSDLILTIYGARWADAVPVIEVLAFYGMSLSVSATTGGVLRAIGKPQVLLYTSVLHHAVQLGLLLTIGRHGVVAIAYAVLVPMLISSSIAFVLVTVYLDARPWQVIEPLVRAGVPAFGMFLIVRGFDGWLDAAFGPPVPVSLASCVVVGSLAYLALSALINRAGLLEFATTVRGVVLSKGDLV